MKLTNSTELDAAAAILHDTRFVANEVEWNAGQHTFRLKCWVHISKHKKVPDAGKWKAWILSFSNVETCSVVIKEKVVYYELSRIRYSKDLRTITLVTHYAVTIDMSVSALDGDLIETNETRDGWKQG
jgi:hypothetical protein